MSFQKNISYSEKRVTAWLYYYIEWEDWKKKNWSVHILGRKYKLPHIYISTCQHTDMNYTFVQVRICGLPASISMLSLTYTVLYSRHHHWVTRVPAGLKGSNCWSGDSPATLFLFSLPPERCCPYALSHNNLCWGCGLYILWTAGGNRLCFLIQKLFRPATTAGGQKKANFCLGAFVLSLWLGLCVMFHLNTDSWANSMRRTKSVEGGGPARCRGILVKGITVYVVSKAAFTPTVPCFVQFKETRKWIRKWKVKSLSYISVCFLHPILYNFVVCSRAAILTPSPSIISQYKTHLCSVSGHSIVFYDRSDKYMYHLPVTGVNLVFPSLVHLVLMIKDVTNQHCPANELFVNPCTQFTCNNSIGKIKWTRTKRQQGIIFWQNTRVKATEGSLSLLSSAQTSSYQRMLNRQRSPAILAQVDSNLFLWHYTVHLYHFHLASASFLFSFLPQLL